MAHSDKTLTFRDAVYGKPIDVMLTFGAKVDGTKSKLTVLIEDKYGAHPVHSPCCPKITLGEWRGTRPRPTLLLLNSASPKHGFPLDHVNDPSDRHPLSVPEMMGRGHLPSLKFAL